MLLILLALLMLGTGVLRAADTFPPAPAHYFNDLAHVTHGDTANQLDQKLQQFERDTSNQILVAVFDKYPSQDDVASYSNNLFRAWKIGQAHKNNGVGLFVWIANHKLFISTGYGLEGALPDATCKQIIDNEITPHFKTGDYDGGLTAGVDAILAATKGEYKGTGHTQGDGSQQNNSLFWFIVAVFIVFTLLSMWRNGRRGYGYSRSGSGWGPFISFGGGFGSGGGFSGGGGFGGGGGFSGGGGSSGGGGAGGSW